MTFTFTVFSAENNSALTINIPNTSTRVLHEKLDSNTEAYEKSRCHGTRDFTTVLTTAQHWYLSWIRRIPFATAYPL